MKFVLRELTKYSVQAHCINMIMLLGIIYGFRNLEKHKSNLKRNRDFIIRTFFRTLTLFYRFLFLLD